MPYWRTFFHITWSTKGREPSLTGEKVPAIERSWRTTCKEQKALVHALYVMPDHVHLAVSIPPSLAVATLVSRLKGSSSHLVRHAAPSPDPSFSWQSEYGVVTFGEKQLPLVVAYIESQPARHQGQQTWSKLEHDCDDQ